jgi:hypothetical protein
MSALKTWLASLRFPVLLLLSALLFLADLFIPDVLPFVDEALLALATVMLGRLKRRPAATADSG